MARAFSTRLISPWCIHRECWSSSGRKGNEMDAKTQKDASLGRMTRIIYKHCQESLQEAVLRLIEENKNGDLSGIKIAAQDILTEVAIVARFSYSIKEGQ